MAYKYIVKFLQDFEHINTGVTLYLEKALFQIGAKTYNIFDLQDKQICTVNNVISKPNSY